MDKSAGSGQAACGADSCADTQHDDEVGVLLMDSTGALGLDLSFVAWVFLMEPLEDASQLLQVAPAPQPRCGPAAQCRAMRCCARPS